MITVKEASFIGYPSRDLNRSRAFYEGVLGLKVTHEPRVSKWMEFEVGNVTLGIGDYGDGWKPSADGALLALEVEDFDAAIAHLKERGIPFNMDAFESPVCHFAIVRDPDGNSLMIHKRKPGRE